MKDRVKARRRSTKNFHPQPSGHAEDDEIRDDHRGGLNEMALRNVKHDRADSVPHFEEKEEGGDGPNQAENDGKEGEHDGSFRLNENAVVQEDDPKQNHSNERRLKRTERNNV